MTDIHREREEWQALFDADTLHMLPSVALIASVKELAQRLLMFTAPWNDFEKALWLLDMAEQSLVEEYHAPPFSEALALLEKHHERLAELRAEAGT